MALLNVDFHSYYLGMDSPLTVLLPEKRGRKPEAAPDKKYPVLYLLHGHADDNTAWIRKSDLELLVRDHDVIVVMPSAHRSFYTNGKYGHLYFDYITKELPIVVSNFFPASTRREDTFIGGLSMGGYGALKAALSCPEQYAGVAAMSAANSPFEAMKAAGTMFSVSDLWIMFTAFLATRRSIRDRRTIWSIWRNRQLHPQDPSRESTTAVDNRIPFTV